MAAGDGQDWRAFVVDHGFRARAHELAAVTDRTVRDIERVRATGALRKRAHGKGFAELFALWHGRAPDDAEWPAPRRQGSRGAYEWQPPEVALLATLVGTLPKKEIAALLTARLRKVTGDAGAGRNETAVQVRMGVIGLQASDLVGGITVSQAAREIGSRPVVNQAIARQELKAAKVGRLWRIGHAEWAAWKAKRTSPPDGYVMLSSIREALAIRSDKLSEFARAGHIPTAIRCNPLGAKGPGTKFGTWWIDPTVARALVADRRAGRPMPWHGKAVPENLRASFRRWQERQHPASCETCAALWGKGGAPGNFEDFASRYPPLAHGAKRHLTRPWTPGLTSGEVAALAGCPASRVLSAIRNGALTATRHGRTRYVTRTDATRWKARHCPTGESERCWLSVEVAVQRYGFTARELRAFVQAGTLKEKEGAFGAMRGKRYVLKNQLAELRAKVGFSEEEAARHVGVTVGRLRHLLDGVAWRQAEGIPLVTVQAAIKRLRSREGYTVEEAAGQLGVAPAWVRARIEDGTIRVSRAKWDRRRVYVSEPMMRRLRQAKQRPRPGRLSGEWLRLGDAAQEAGVSATTLQKWAADGEIDVKAAPDGARCHREAVRARARRYWENVRLKRAIPPAWLVQEGQAAA